MKKYLVDTNIFLRFLLKDNQKFYQQAKKYFILAHEKKIKLSLISPVVFELDYVLKGVYGLKRDESADLLRKLISLPILEVENREILLEAIEKYKKLNVNLFDLYLWEMAKQEKAKVLSFDKDFKKIKDLKSKKSRIVS